MLHNLGVEKKITQKLQVGLNFKNNYKETLSGIELNIQFLKEKNLNSIFLYNIL